MDTSDTQLPNNLTSTTVDTLDIPQCVTSDECCQNTLEHTAKRDNIEMVNRLISNGEKDTYGHAL